jgi:hypothetical protein
MPFIDPRIAQNDQSAPPARDFAERWEELARLHDFCRAGRTYDVERWIADRRPFQVAFADLPRRGRRQQTALEIAIEAGNHSLVLLLLTNGYDPNQEYHSPLDHALHDRRWDLVDLLLDGGARPANVDPDAVFGTYQTPLFERFRRLGVDFAAGHALASALADHTSNKPLFGFVRRWREVDSSYQKELNIALGHHTSKGNEKGVMLCLWAGADPHAPAPSLRYGVSSSADSDADDEDDTDYGVSAVWQACCSGHAEILKRFKPDPHRDDFSSLYRVARDAATIKLLIDIEPPQRPGAVICSIVQEMVWQASLDRWGTGWHSRYGTIYALEALFEAGIRWPTPEPDETAAVRASLIKLGEYDFIRVVKLLATSDYCSPEVLAEIGRTPAFRRRMREVGFIPPDEHDRRRRTNVPPTRSREVLKKFRLEPPKPAAAEPHVPQHTRIGRYRPGTSQRTITREELFDRVWTTPVETLAAEWGLSGRGLAKACARLQVSVPPRGYWARLSAGQRPRRPPLKVLKDGRTPSVTVWEAGVPT